MQDPNLTATSTFKYEKRLQIFIAIYLSIILLSIVLILVMTDMSAELRQALVIVLGLILIATLDAFKKSLSSKPFPLKSVSIGNQIIIRDGGFYVGGDYVGGSINHGIENRQTLAEAAVEIHKLLQELEKFNPNATEAEKVAYVNEEVAPAFKSRVASAVKETGESEAALEIQLLLQQMEKSDSTVSGDKVIGDKITSGTQTPSFRSRVIGALQAGGEAATEEFLNNTMYARLAQAVIKGWLSLEGTQQSTQHNKPDGAN